MVMRALLVLLLLFSGSVAAALPARYMQTTEAAAVWAQIGNKMVTVGNIRAGQILSVEPIAADYYEFTFGFGTGFIDKGHLEPVQGRQKVDDGLGDLNKPLSNQSLITWKDTPVYNAPDVGSAPFGVLADNLRYPIISKLKDRLNQTWFQIRIGGRLAYISALDAQEDHGIPVLTYHHILRDEENTRFRHTSTTTSVRAFSNQMAWLRDRGYTTLTMYQLEGYVQNKMNRASTGCCADVRRWPEVGQPLCLSCPKAVRDESDSVYHFVAYQAPPPEVGPEIAAVYEHL